MAQSVVFNGSSQYAYVNNGLIDQTIPYSFETWVKLGAEIGSGSWDFMNLENNTQKWTTNFRYEYNGGSRRLNGKSTRWVLIGFSAFHTIALGTSEWTHLAYTRSSTAGKLYVNGVNVGTDSTITDNLDGTTTVSSEFRIGAGKVEGSATTRNYANTKMWDTRVWSDVRTPTEIADNMYELTGSGNLVARYLFDGTLNATTGPNLTGVGTPTYSSDVPTRLQGGSPMLFGGGVTIG